MKNFWRLSIFFVLNVALTALPVETSAADEPAGSVVFDLTAGVEGMAGDTTSRIGGNIINADGSMQRLHFPLNEQEWPLGFWLGRIDAGLSFGPSWRVNGVVKKDISDPDGSMIYQDWITLGSPGQLDIYSESDISGFDAVIFDVDVEWLFLQRQNWSVFAGLGYQYQNFDYEGKPVYQYSPSGLPGAEQYGDGSVGITYEVSTSMPYVLVGTDITLSEKIILSGSFAYAPWIDTEDEVSHVYRNLLGKGDMDGSAYMFDLSARYNITSSWFLVAGFHYTMIDVDGTMNITQNGVAVIQSIDEEVESSQTSAYLQVGFSF